MGEVPRRLRRFSRGGDYRGEEEPAYESVDESIADSLEYPSSGERPSERARRKINPKEEAAEAIYNQLKLQREMKDRTSEMAIREVKTFKEEHRRYPTDKEYDEIADSIYRQLKEEYENEKRKEDEAKRLAREREKEMKKRGREGPAPRGEGEGRNRRALRGGREQGVPVGGAPQKGIGLGEIGDISPIEAPLGEEKKPDAGDISALLGEGNVEKDTLDIGGLSESKDFDLSALGLEMEEGGGDDGLLTLEAETNKNKCPHCGTKTEDLVFCPNCGEGFCPHCASKAEVGVDSVKYACPKCKHEFKVRK